MNYTSYIKKTFLCNNVHGSFYYEENNFTVKWLQTPEGARRFYLHVTYQNPKRLLFMETFPTTRLPIEAFPLKQLNYQ